MPSDAVREIWVGGLEALERGCEFCGAGAGYYDGGALFEGGFGDAEADARGSAEDEDAGGGELGGVFGGVGGLLGCHCAI